MSSKLERTTFTITQNQIKWLAEQSEKTGLNKVEIVRRALDEYSEREDAKAEHQLFTPEQRKKSRRSHARRGFPNRMSSVSPLIGNATDSSEDIEVCMEIRKDGHIVWEKVDRSHERDTFEKIAGLDAICFNDKAYERLTADTHIYGDIYALKVNGSAVGYAIYGQVWLPELPMPISQG